MDDLTLILLLPIVFMIHEFEEMILFPLLDTQTHRRI